MTVRIPPVVLVAVCGGLSWLVSQPFPAGRYGFPGQSVLAGVLIGLGAAILIASVLAFIRARTTVNPVSPERASTLVTDGLYRLSRNPMYLAMALVLTGFALLLHNVAALVGPVVFVAAMTVFQIKPEEVALRARFGEAFEAYCRRTRRWI